MPKLSDTTYAAIIRTLLSKADGAAINTVVDATERRALTGLTVGMSRVIQADLIGIIWNLVADDATLDASWIGLPYTVDPDGDVVINMELADMTGIVPDANVLGQVGGRPTIGDGAATGGLNIGMTSDLLSLTLVGDATNDVKAYALDEWAVHTAITANWQAYASSLTTLHIGQGVTTIGSGAFQYCSGFTGSLTIPDSVTSVGTYAFYFCSGFTGNLTIGDSVTTISSGAFQNCSGLTGNLTILDSVTTIGSFAFYGCSNITNVDCHVTRTLMNASSCLTSTGVTTLHAEAGKGWTAGADTIGGKALTVIIDL